MARVTVEDCLERVPNRFHLVMLAAKRARQMALYGKPALLASPEDKPTVMALREIAEGLVTRDNIDGLNLVQEDVDDENVEEAVSS